MAEATINIDDHEAGFKPGGQITGEVSWVFRSLPEWVDVRVLWYTEGKGDPDIQTAATERFASPSITDKRRFEFTLPLGPYSYSGRLISLMWAVVLVSDDDTMLARTKFVLSPTSKELSLESDLPHVVAR